MADRTPEPDQSEPRWSADFDASVIAQTLDQMYVESPHSTHPFVARMQPVNPVDLVAHVLHEAEKQIASRTPDEQSAKATCRGCGAELGERHNAGCPYAHPWPRDRVDNVQTRINPVSSTSPSESAT